jgi:hypothetical protein
LYIVLKITYSSRDVHASYYYPTVNEEQEEKKETETRHKGDMDPVNLKKSLYIKQKMLMFGLGGYRHNHPTSISLGNSVMSPLDENCPRRGLVQFPSLGDVTSIPCEIESRAVISSIMDILAAIAARGASPQNHVYVRFMFVFVII